MATTALWQVSDNLNRVLEYASDKDKTEAKDGLKDVIVYASNNQKTGRLVTGINCSPKNVYKQMVSTKKAAGKEDGVQAFHGYQSFNKDEVDEATCHQLGIELAKRMWGDDFEVLVCTHTNTDHYHNHFVVNSVSWTTRKRFCNTHEDYRRFRRLSDELCNEYHLGVIENPLKGKMNYDEIKAIMNGKPYIRGMVKSDVELAINNARTFTQFKSNMKDMGYSFDESRKAHLTVITPDGNHHIRLDNIHPKGTYTIEGITERILNNEVIKWESVSEHKSKRVFHYKKNQLPKRKITGLRALYCRYLYMLGILPKKGPRRRVSFSLVNDLKHIDQYNEEVQIIVDRKISDITTLKNLITTSKDELQQLSKERKRLQTRKSRTTDSGEIKVYEARIKLLSSQIVQLRKEVKIYERIEIHSAHMEEKIKENIQQRKVEEDERRSGQRRTNHKDVFRGN